MSRASSTSLSKYMNDSNNQVLILLLLLWDRYTQIFQEYQGILQTHIERLVTSCDTTTEEFNEALKANHDGETPLYVDIILAADDYLNFVHMMKHYKEKLAEASGGSANAEAADAGEAQPAAGTGDSAQWAGTPHKQGDILIAKLL